MEENKESKYKEGKDARGSKVGNRAKLPEDGSRRFE